MKSLPPSDRPREKLERAGVAALGDNELVAVIIGHGTASAGALEIANDVLVAAGGLHGLLRTGPEELGQVSGVGEALAGRLIAAVELGRRTLACSPAPRRQFLTSVDCGVFLLPRFGSHPVERFGVMLLDARRRLIRAKVL